MNQNLEVGGTHPDPGAENIKEGPFGPLHQRDNKITAKSPKYTYRSKLQGRQ